MYEELVKRLREHNGWALNETLDEAADAIEELQAQIDGWVEQERKALLKSVPKWIPVSERLLEEWKTVLTFQPTATDDKGIIQTCVYIGIPGKWRQAWNHEFLELPVTHWMPLPEPPKEEENHVG